MCVCDVYPCLIEDEDRKTHTRERRMLMELRATIGSRLYPRMLAVCTIERGRSPIRLRIFKGQHLHAKHTEYMPAHETTAMP